MNKKLYTNTLFVAIVPLSAVLYGEVQHHS